jgi:hypothetical protein
MPQAGDASGDATGMQPIVFLDFDEVIVLNEPGRFGGYDALAPNPPFELWSRLFHAPAVATLIEALEEHDARVVITTSWLRFMLRPALEGVFEHTGLQRISHRLHDAWEAPQQSRETRLNAINRWLSENHRGEPYVILDDADSGTGLRGSRHDLERRVVMCDPKTCLQRTQLGAIRFALTAPPALL